MRLIKTSFVINGQHLIDSGCSDFYCVLQSEMEIMGTLKKNGDLLGTQNLKKQSLEAHTVSINIAP